MNGAQFELKKQQNRAKRRREGGVEWDRKTAQELQEQFLQEEGAAGELQQEVVEELQKNWLQEEEEAKALQEEKDAEVAKSLSEDQVTLASSCLIM